MTDDLMAAERLRLEHIASRWQADDSEAAKDIRWLVWQLGAAWDFISQDKQILETTGQMLRDMSGDVPRRTYRRIWNQALRRS